jgi:nucleotidyltransferase substrate binding protein (TIGR01987 family)
MENIRWKQRFENFENALSKLDEAIKTYADTKSDIIKEGIIQRFEFTHELAWKVMKDFLQYEGHQDITGSRTAARKAFNIGLIRNGDIWMDMIESRNNTVHTYNEEILQYEYDKILNQYLPEFKDFFQHMKTKF